MNKRPTIRDGLTRWNLEQVRRLYAHLLQRPGPEGRGRVDDHLRVKYQLVNLPRYVELIAVSCTPSGRRTGLICARIFRGHRHATQAIQRV